MNTQIVNQVVSAAMIARSTVVACVAIVGLIVAMGGCSDNNNSSDNGSTAGDAAADTPPQMDDVEIRKSLDAAEQYFNAGEYNNARLILTRLVRDAPNELTARELLGQTHAAEASSHEQAGRAREAAASRQQAWEQYRQAVELAPEQAGLHHSAALMALAAGERNEAMALLVEATRLDQSNPQYPLYLSQFLIQDLRLDEAEALITKAIALSPDEPHLHATLAAIELERGNYDNALVHVREARDIAPAETAFRVQEAKILRRSGRPGDALMLLTSLTEQDRVQEYVAWEMAANYEALNDSLAAAQTWERCYRANPLHPNAWRWAVTIGEVLARADRTAEATMWLQEAQRLNPNAAEVAALAATIKSAGGP